MLNPKALGLSGGILFGASLFFVTLISVYTGYAGSFLEILTGIYPGYSVTLIGSVVGLVYGFVDVFIGLFLLTWLSNVIERVWK